MTGNEKSFILFGNRQEEKKQISVFLLIINENPSLLSLSLRVSVHQVRVSKERRHEDGSPRLL